MRETTRSVYVSLAHRYWNFGWDRAQNHDVYGHLASPEGVGANLRLDLSADDEHDLGPATRRLKDLVDHRALFKDVPEFTREPSTLERIATYLADRHGADSWRALTVHETERLSCVVSRDGQVRVRERIFNLTVECAGDLDRDSGVLLKRGTLAGAVRKLAPRFAGRTADTPGEFADRLFAGLRAEVPACSALEVRLNPRESVRVTTQIKGESHA